MEYKKRLTRSTTDKWLAGVCGGIAEYFGWDVHRLCRPDDLHGLLWRTGVYPPLDLHAEGDEVYRVRRQSKKTAEDSLKVILLVQR